MRVIDGYDVIGIGEIATIMVSNIGAPTTSVDVGRQEDCGEVRDKEGMRVCNSVAVDGENQSTPPEDGNH